jgi:sugar phosphate isomerase/epimerase
MRIGCCGSTIAPATDAIGIDTVETLAELGFDYVELSLADLAALPGDAFARLAARLDRSGLRCEACNNFFPPRLRLTGEDADPDRALAYAGLALARAAALGARVVVFGSAGAKNVPAGFPREAAWQQLVSLLRQLGFVAAEHDLEIAIEPINRVEANIVNLAGEGLDLAAAVDHANVRLLVDYYHLMMEREDLDVVLRAGPAIRHVHVAQVEGRRFPASIEADAAAFFERLHRIGYDRRCSIEAFTSDFRADAARALCALRQAADRQDAAGGGRGRRGRP